ncbi:hypothetical protein FRUB_10489 [Fimbriiglobus ruber]|uniref:Uncharacterized protein n=1 Tax=Fimbriiglobus ruber TaxID=1908690 RepID=A0A225D7J4_9BACT|nr:hypothetical protein FRUB_10489 [Fimbriiglobus ruber]
MIERTKAFGGKYFGHPDCPSKCDDPPVLKQGFQRNKAFGRN